ncbi:hypothetical protein [Flavobacterium sandaracinum]|uniref:Uncharacterized protein n=1 Tax=Flavobacterium sandaracinum TaxID=2541733 RepID=A0A4R5CUG7_9FLAO|nr:hypothetical protein [Flavobacterium sandaracinum]TDE01393.1 hypothetical protein E0F91_14805 [Flavobacterium sandaracinum]
MKNFKCLNSLTLMILLMFSTFVFAGIPEFINDTVASKRLKENNKASIKLTQNFSKGTNNAIPCNTVEPIPLINGSTFDALATSNSTTGLCLLGCGVSDVTNLVDASLTNFATVITAVGVGVTHNLRVIDGNDAYLAGTFAGFRISPSTGLLSLDLLNSITIKTYSGPVLKESFSGSQLLNLSLASIPGGDFILGFNSSQSFDSVEISFNSLVGAVSSTDVYYAVITTYCAGPTLTCNLATAMNLPTFPVAIESSHTGISGVGIGSVTNTENLISPSLTDFASISFTTSLLASGSVAVKDQITNYPAGTFAGFDIENTSLLDVNAFDAITISTFLNGVLQESNSGNGQLISIGTDLIVGTGRKTVGFVSTLAFDEVQITINQLVGVTLGETKIYNAVFESFCAGPPLACNVVTPITAPTYPIVVNGANTGIDGLVCALCSVSNTGNLIDADTSNFAEVSLTASVGVSGSVSVKNQITSYAAGTFAGYDIESTSLLDVNAFDAITIRTFLNGVVQETKSGNSQLISIGTDLLVGTGRKTVGFVATLPFDEVKITFTNLLTVTLGNTKIYNAVFESFCAGPPLACNIVTPITAPTYPIVVNGANTGIDGLVCALCSVSNTDNLIDADTSNFAEVSLTASVGVSGSVSVKNQITSYAAGTFAGYDIESTSLLDVNAFDAITIRTFLNGVVQETKSGNGQLISIGTDLLVGTGRKTVGFVATLPFDEVKITFTNLLTVALGNTKIYNAVFESFCAATVQCDVVYALTNPTFPVAINSNESGIQGVACVACAVSDSDNVLSSDINDFANITLTVGVLATGSVSVKDQLYTYPVGTFAGFTIQDLNNLLELNLFQSLIISTFNNGVLQESKGGPQLIGLSLLVPILGSGPGFYNVGFEATVPFDEIKITVNSLATVINNVNVYGAFVDTNNSNDGVLGFLNCTNANPVAVDDSVTTLRHHSKHQCNHQRHRYRWNGRREHRRFRPYYRGHTNHFYYCRRRQL